MSSKKRLGKDNKKSGRIPSKATEVKERPRPSVCYHYMSDTVVALDELNQEFIVQMLKQFKVLGGISWDDISQYKGLGWDSIPQHRMKYTIPKSLNRDDLYHIKVSKKGRVWGYREGNSFHLVWFDPNHKVTPE